MKPSPHLRPSIAWALLYMRVSAAVLLLVVHGLPKVLNWHAELGLIEDPLHLGAALTLSFAVFAEVLCPLLIILGLYARLACLPVLCGAAGFGGVGASRMVSGRRSVCVADDNSLRWPGDCRPWVFEC